MGRFEMDRDGVGGLSAAVRGDPGVLRGVAGGVAAAGAPARAGAGAEAGGLRAEPDRLRLLPSPPLDSVAGAGAELDRFRLVHAALLDAVADAIAALGGDLDVAVSSDRATEVDVVSALAARAGAVRWTGGS